MTTAEKLVTLAENVPKVYEAGRTAEWSEFWDNYQGMGTVAYYGSFFASKAWTAKTFRPKYDIVPVNASSLFNNFNNGAAPLDMVEHLATLGVKLDFAKCTNFSYMVATSNISRLGIIDTRGANSASGVNNIFRSAAQLVTIDKLIVNEAFPVGTGSFVGCSKLADISIEGYITGDFVIDQSPLTNISMKSILTHLKDSSGTEKAGICTVKFSAACWAALDAEGETSPNGNTWKEYVTNLGWKWA